MHAALRRNDSHRLSKYPSGTEADMPHPVVGAPTTHTCSDNNALIDGERRAMADKTRVGSAATGTRLIPAVLERSESC